MLTLLLLLAGPAHADLPPAFNLPKQADLLRQLGVPPEQATAALRAMQAAGLSAEEAQTVLKVASEAAYEHGPVPAFDALIQDSLEEGLRGEMLTAAITQAHLESGQGTESIRKGPPAEGTGSPAEGGSQVPVPQQAPEPAEAQEPSPQEPSPQEPGSGGRQ